MKRYLLAYTPLSLALIFPFFAFAQAADKDSVQGFIVLITQFIGNTLIPFLFAIALLFFLVNTARYFIIGGGKSEDQEKAKTLALYGIGAFVFLVSLWGIVNMFVNAFEIDDDEAKCPDYLSDWCTSKDSYNNQFNSYSNYRDDGSYFDDEYAPPSYETFDPYDEDGYEPTNENGYAVPDGTEGTKKINIRKVNIRTVEEGDTVAEPAEETDVHNDLTERPPVNLSGSGLPPITTNGDCTGSGTGEEVCGTIDQKYYENQ